MDIIKNIGYKKIKMLSSGLSNPFFTKINQKVLMMILPLDSNTLLKLGLPILTKSIPKNI